MMHLSADPQDCRSSPESTCASKGEATERHGKTHTASCPLPEYKPDERRGKKKNTTDVDTHTHKHTYMHKHTRERNKRRGLLLTVFSLEVWNELLVIVGNLS